jgi:drug/metabolite transporter superfamily protein YnfA
LGGVILFIYGIIPTLQPSNFGRVYAAYGGIFIVSSIIWGALVGKKKPDRYEIVGSLGVYRFWRDLGFVFGAVGIGFIADLFNLSIAIQLVALISLASGVFVFIVMRETRRKKVNGAITK